VPLCLSMSYMAGLSADVPDTPRRRLTAHGTTAIPRGVPGAAGLWAA
jgi:hypothetical protein